MEKPLTVSFDEWTLHRESGELERAGQRVRLQDLPFQILDELLARPGEVVTREQLIARLWPKTVVDYDANLNSSVRRLRAALHDDAEAPRYIETVPRKGYRYIGSAPCYGPVRGAAKPSLRRRPAFIATAAVAVLVAGAAFYMWYRLSEPAASRTLESRIAPERHLRIAVLPFENLSPDPANGFFTDGLHEEILSAIATRAPYLEVISRTTMTVYQAAPRSVRDIANELHLTHVLEGSVRRDGERVRLTLQLIDARTDAHLWSKNFDRRLLDTLTLQSEVAEDVATQLAVKLSGAIGELPPSSNAQAFDLYLRARVSMRTVAAIRSAADQQSAEQLLNGAIALDPGFGAAYLERARVRLSKFTTSQDTSESNVTAIRDDLAAARRIMGDAPPLLFSEALYASLVDLDPDRALTLLNRAQAIHPNSSELCLAFARQLGSTGQPTEALVYFKRAAELDPANPVVISDWAATLKMARQAQESLRVSREFDARYPGAITYGLRVFDFTGDLSRFEREVAAAQTAEERLTGRFDLLLFSNQTAQLDELLEHADLRTIRQVSYGGFSIPAVGRKPVAELRGWVKLLAHDRAGAARDGRILREFVEHESATKWNEWYLRMLAAEAALFSGEREQAAAEARHALAIAPRNVHIGIQRYAPAVTARILAWAGAGDDAVELLEKLSTEFPMMGPAEILRDPLYTQPLGENAKFKALAQRLNVELAANQRLRDPSEAAASLNVERNASRTR